MQQHRWGWQAMCGMMAVSASHHACCGTPAAWFFSGVGGCCCPCPDSTGILEALPSTVQMPTALVFCALLCHCCPAPPPLSTRVQGVLASGGEDNLVAVWSLDRAGGGAGSGRSGRSTGVSVGGKEAPPELLFKHVGHKGGVSGALPVWRLWCVAGE
jgi:hypothetical protein